MIPQKELQQCARHLWREMAPACATCDKRVDSFQEERSGFSQEILVTFYCHGKHEVVRLDPMASKPLDAWPKRLFLKNWARYATTTKPERRRV